MKPILYEASERSFDTYGLGTLYDVISCYVSEERNGEYELEMEYPISGIHFSEIEKRMIVLAKPNYTDDPQPFRIYKITKPLNGICTIYAEHITYDMSGFIMPGGQSADGSIEACELLTEYANNFTITATKTGSAEFATDVPASVRSWLGGKTGSLLDLYGGEWKWDMFTATLMTERGTDRGVVIRYGKNLLELEQEEESDNLYTAVVGYWYDSESETLVTGSEVETGLTLDTPRVYVYDLTSEYDEAPTVSTIDARIETYISSNDLTTPSVNITLTHSQIGTLSERVDLCDTVTVIYEKLGVSATAECIETRWDVLKERYDSLTFGDPTTNISDRIVEAEKAAEETRSTLEAAIARVSARIKGTSGGYVVHNDTDGDSYIDELLIMDSPSIEDAVKLWRWNLSGLGYSSTGYDGTYGTAMTMDGEIVADYITTGTMYANRIKGGTLTLGGSSNTYGVLKILDNNGDEIGSWDRSGITATNGDFSGKITAATGSSLGGWTATNKKLYATGEDGEVAVVQVPSDSTTWCFAAGGTSHSSYGDCPFRVHKSGALYAEDATITGTISTTSGKYTTTISGGMVNVIYNSADIGAIFGTTSSGYKGFYIGLDYDSHFMSFGRKKTSSATGYTNFLCYDTRGYDTGYSDTLHIYSRVSAKNFIQQGVIKFTDVGVGKTNGSYTFAETFDNTPRIFVQPITTMPDHILASVASTSKSGFTLYVTRDSEAGSGDTNVAWVAIAQPTDEGVVEFG